MFYVALRCVRDSAAAGLGLEADRPERCVQLVQYANSKLMLVSHSHELNRRLNHGFVNQGAFTRIEQERQSAVETRTRVRTTC